MNRIVENDLKKIFASLTEEERLRFKDKTILFTGCAGFLGFYFLRFFTCYKQELGIKKVIGLDNFKVGKPAWIEDLLNQGAIELHPFDIITDNISEIAGAKDANFIYHMASIASPVFYRKYPIETLDANVWGLRALLDFYKDKNIDGMVFFSSSEIYGDPTPENIPTPETYRGNVDCQGPRACYDEAKRFGETICYLYNKQYNIPITVIRPFNNYGPGMRLNDRRVPADFALAVLQNKDITMLSDGSPTRTFCYISDAITGYIKGLLYNKSFEAFNIGIDKPEISVKKLAEIYQAHGKALFGYTGRLYFTTDPDREYLTNNPGRRCPNIDKARNLLGYDPKMDPETGVKNFLEYIKTSKENELIW